MSLNSNFSPFLILPTSWPGGTQAGKLAKLPILSFFLHFSLTPPNVLSSLFDGNQHHFNDVLTFYANRHLFLHWT